MNIKISSIKAESCLSFFLLLTQDSSGLTATSLTKKITETLVGKLEKDKIYIYSATVLVYIRVKYVSFFLFPCWYYTSSRMSSGRADRNDSRAIFTNGDARSGK